MEKTKNKIRSVCRYNVRFHLDFYGRGTTAKQLLLTTQLHQLNVK